MGTSGSESGQQKPPVRKTGTALLNHLISGNRVIRPVSASALSMIIGSHK
jgi:hypothetical protein